MANLAAAAPLTLMAICDWICICVRKNSRSWRRCIFCHKTSRRAATDGMQKKDAMIGAEGDDMSGGMGGIVLEQVGAGACRA